MITLDEQIEWVERTLNRSHLSDYQTLTDILATLRSVKAEPDGWVLVPKEPTPEMTQAIEDHFRKWQKITNCSDDDVKADCWSALVAFRAALAAAPAAPQSPGR